MNKFCYALFWNELSIIYKLKSKKTLLETYRNSYLHLIDHWAAVAVYIHTQTTYIHRQTDTQTQYSLAHAHRGTTTTWRIGQPDNQNCWIMQTTEIHWSTLYNTCSDKSDAVKRQRNQTEKPGWKQQQPDVLAIEIAGRISNLPAYNRNDL